MLYAEDQWQKIPPPSEKHLKELTHMEFRHGGRYPIERKDDFAFMEIHKNGTGPAEDIWAVTISIKVLNQVVLRYPKETHTVHFYVGPWPGNKWDPTNFPD